MYKQVSKKLQTGNYKYGRYGIMRRVLGGKSNWHIYDLERARADNVFYFSEMCELYHMRMFPTLKRCIQHIDMWADESGNL